jgi:shikimate kinase / 3-dehydroquinate synthase
MNSIFLYGPPGSGKSSVGSRLAQKIKLDFIDLDREIEKNTGMSISQIMKEHGEKGFRELEFQTLSEAVKGRQKVVALGGGALLREDSRKCVEQSGRVVFLEGDLPTLLSRLKGEPNLRPLLADDPKSQLARLLEDRARHYAAFKRRVSTIDKAPEQIADEIQRLLGRFHVNGMGHDYDVILHEGSLEELPEYFTSKRVGGPVAIVCDENVASLYGNSLGKLFPREGKETGPADWIILPPGEGQKKLESVVLFWERFLEAGLDRKSTVVAVGGGVIGDLAGFAASTYLRGIAWVNIPTSLLAMVDASIGGKTGFNLPEGKNLVGSFHPASLVLACPSFLESLPEIEFRSGLAEVVKHGILADPELFDLCAEGTEHVRKNLVEVVRRAMAVKVDVILEDPYEKGRRAMLNLGHTVGHAIEKVSEYKIRHGEAVSMGMVAEAKLSERLGIAKNGLSGRIRSVLQRLGLPVEIPAGLKREGLIEAMRMDKKREQGIVRFPLPVEIGKVQLGVGVPDLEMNFMEEK